MSSYTGERLFAAARGVFGAGTAAAVLAEMTELLVTARMTTPEAVFEGPTDGAFGLADGTPRTHGHRPSRHCFGPSDSGVERVAPRRSPRACLLCLGHIRKARQVQLVRNGYRLRRTIAVLGQDQIRLPAARVVPFERIGAVQQDHEVAILFYGAGFP